MTSRRTIARETSLEGVGLHLGKPCRITFRPARGGDGISFVRTDLEGSPRIPARIDVAVQTERRTQLGEGVGALHTVEHVLAAVAGSGDQSATVKADASNTAIVAKALIRPVAKRRWASCAATSSSPLRTA